jgi:hypothetical protein
VPTSAIAPAEMTSRQARANSSAADKQPRADQIAQAILLVILFAGSALMCLHGDCASDADIWWQMRAGEWIVQHHAVPYVDTFSAQLAGHPWLDYSWLFDVLTVKLFQGHGLAGIAVYTCGLVVAIAMALFHLVRRLQREFILAVLLTFVALFSMGHLYTPRSWLFSILFFVFELDILMHVRRTGRLYELAWLPVIFALWANVHIQFVNGLLVLALALTEAILARWWAAAETRIRPAWMAAAFIASLAATLINPYGWRVYVVAHDLATQSGALNKISELQAIPFRNLADFVVLLFALGAAAALAWQRRLLFFEGALLAAAMVLSFRSQRDVWLVATVAATILAAYLPRSGTAAESRTSTLVIGLAGIGAALVVALGFRAMGVDDASLQATIGEELPVRAVEVVKQRGYAGPLFNDFSWGGYLIWNLRLPVSIDGRQNLYGDERMDRSVATWTGQPDWASDPQLAGAGLVIGPTGAPLTQLLRLDPRFHLAYEDKVAAVFIARR